MYGIINYILVLIKKIVTNLTTVDNHVVRNYNELTDPVTGLDAIKTATGTVDGRLTSATDGLGAIKTAVDNANGTLGNGTYGLAAIKTAVDAIGSGGGGSVIKSIQRGTVQYQAPQNNTAQNIPISTIDPSKSFVIIDAITGGSFSGTAGHLFGGIVSSLTANTLTLTVEALSQVTLNISWQVIEFN